MNYSKKRLFVAVMMTAALTTMPKIQPSNVVHADATIKEGTSVVVKSTELKSKKVIVVPKKVEAPKTSSKSLSRGAASSSSSNVITATYNGNSSVIAYAYNFIGKPYVWGASGPNAFDCSGFVAYVYSSFGVSLPHYTGAQFGVGQSVSQDALSPGDLVFFNTYGPVSHVGIYIGGGQFIHASSGSHRVTTSSLSESYYASRYAGARRVK